ncbi:hypothetical protein EVAR_19822_1 [Eumeta japonica]|uniref:Uncharacterized protein n=1 Tax=Eumeta variegata TaxID=151549 RepID=A0A4C1URE2_EUMVA|nr:hypothetical protein EVAR_19822_1 [Eumeta japonica]
MRKNLLLDLCYSHHRSAGDFRNSRTVDDARSSKSLDTSKQLRTDSVAVPFAANAVAAKDRPTMATNSQLFRTRDRKLVISLLKKLRNGPPKLPFCAFIRANRNFRAPAALVKRKLWVTREVFKITKGAIKPQVLSVLTEELNKIRKALNKIASVFDSDWRRATTKRFPKPAHKDRTIIDREF